MWNRIGWFLHDIQLSLLVGHQRVRSCLFISERWLQVFNMYVASSSTSSWTGALRCHISCSIQMQHHGRAASHTILHPPTRHLCCATVSLIVVSTSVNHCVKCVLIQVQCITIVLYLPTTVASDGSIVLHSILDMLNYMHGLEHSFSPFPATHHVCPPRSLSLKRVLVLSWHCRNHQLENR